MLHDWKHHGNLNAHPNGSRIWVCNNCLWELWIPPNDPPPAPEKLYDYTLKDSFTCDDMLARLVMTL